jgi:hypothetical protein
MARPASRRRHGLLSLVWLSVAAAFACEGPPAAERPALATYQASVDPDVPVGSEIYECWLFDARPLQGAAVHGLKWTAPSGPLLLHHAMMFATSATGTYGPTPCDPMPPAVAVLPLYAPGGESTTLADGVSIVIPGSAQSLFVEMHLYRRDLGSSSASVDFLASEAPPAHLAHWVDDFADFPAMPPHTMAKATASCRFAGPAHVVGSWPHMHRLGTHFEGTIVRANGAREPLLTVPIWDFDHQPLYAVDAALADGDGVETACNWDNETDFTVQSGLFSGDEMCNQGLVVWPAESAVCVR